PSPAPAPAIAPDSGGATRRAGGRSPASLLATAPDRVRFRVRTATPQFTPPPGQAEAGMVQMTIAGCALEAKAGEPALPVRIVRVAVPPAGPVGVEATGALSVAHDAIRLAPLPERRTDMKQPLVYSARELTSRGRSLRPARAELRQLTWVRNQRVAEIAVFPADYDAATRRATWWRQVDVAVSFTPSAPVTHPAETDDPFEPVYRGALVNYAQGRAWRRPSRAAARASLAPDLVQRLASAVPDSSLFVGRTWIKIAVRRSGFYKVTFAQLRQLALFNQNTGVVADSLRMFTWGTVADPRAIGSPLMPEKDYCDSCGYRQVALGFSLADGLHFGDNADYLYFYALGPNAWANEYDPSAPDTIHIDHPYDTRTWYLLTVSGDNSVAGNAAAVGTVDRIDATLDGTPGAGTTPATFRERLHYEDDKEYYPDATPLEPSPTPPSIPSTQRWEKWFWRTLIQGGIFNFGALAAPGVDGTQAARLRSVIWGLNWPNVPEGFTPTLPTHFLDVSLNGTIQFPRRGFDGPYPQLYDTTFTGLDSLNTFSFSVPVVNDPGNPQRIDSDGLAWVDVFYQRRFVPYADTLLFESPGAGPHRYAVGPFSSVAAATAARVFDVTWPNAPREVTNMTRDALGMLNFTLADATGERYRVVSTAQFLTPSQTDIVSQDPVANLRSSANVSDYLVIYYDPFKAAADSLVAWRSDHLPLSHPGPYLARAVPISAIYDQFSGGREDPAAIRGFMRAVFFNWNGGSPRVSYVTLLGDASYDHKNVLGDALPGQVADPIPTFENNYDSFALVRREYTTDDWLFDVVREGGETVSLPDFYVGRLPVNDLASALDLVHNKVLLAERANALGEWRNRVMLVADDNVHGSSTSEWFHLQQTAALDESHLPWPFDRQYVYEYLYANGPGNTKPGAAADIRQNIDDGVLVFNFVGHGSPFQMADERVFLDSDVGTLHNAPRFGLFVSASCDVGKFIDPTVQSLGERLITTTGGGTIAVISATELALSFDNATLNGDIYDALFTPEVTRAEFEGAPPETLDRPFLPYVPDAPGRVAPALLCAKILSPSTNSTKYELLGDAAATLPLPQYDVELTVADSSGDTTSVLPHGNVLTFKGRVLDAPGGSLVPIDGVASVRVEDAKPEVTAPPGYVVYPYKAGTIFQGDVGVHGGVFQGKFFVPLEAREGPKARVRAYVQGRPGGGLVDVDAVGAASDSVAPGSPAPGDVTGPRITLSFPGGSSSVRPDATLRVDLFDPSGILTTGHTPQNGIVVTVDGNTATRADITPSFRYAADSYQSGTATYTLPGLATGAHTITVSAADNLASGLSAAAHRSSATVDFQVVTSPPLDIVRSYLFPDPTHSKGPGAGGEFVVDVAGDSVNVLLRIYTASGRLVRTLHRFGAQGQVQIPWDGRDAEGDELANGVYFYTVHLNPRDTDGSSSPRQHADSQGRLVILNR
ncbi:MAG TPA: C25 family cysteine peptidase, partial [Candidatus Eisenbacteria bacterium]|nr:C25 family cysteine peptidase [Candidatus Eisenbacteria bacterium]